jgi:hypothetical protein
MAILSEKMLRQLVQEEISNLKTTKQAAKETREVEADELADTLEKKIDMLKALKIKEHKLVKQIRSLQEQAKRNKR